MGYLLPKTNQHYRGQSWAVGILALAAVHTLGVALAKLALPDSGLISLGGLNLAHEGGLQMVAMAARGGATQLVWGLVLAFVVLRHRDLTGLFVLLVAVEKALFILSGLIKPVTEAMALPGNAAAAVLLALSVIALFGARAAKSSD